MRYEYEQVQSYIVQYHNNQQYIDFSDVHNAYIRYIAQYIAQKESISAKIEKSVDEMAAMVVYLWWVLEGDEAIEGVYSVQEEELDIYTHLRCQNLFLTLSTTQSPSTIAFLYLFFHFYRIFHFTSQVPLFILGEGSAWVHTYIPTLTLGYPPFPLDFTPKHISWKYYLDCFRIPAQVSTYNYIPFDASLNGLSTDTFYVPFPHHPTQKIAFFQQYFSGCEVSIEMKSLQVREEEAMIVSLIDRAEKSEGDICIRIVGIDYMMGELQSAIRKVITFRYYPPGVRFELVGSMSFTRQWTGKHYFKPQISLSIHAARLYLRLYAILLRHPNLSKCTLMAGTGATKHQLQRFISIGVLEGGVVCRLYKFPSLPRSPSPFPTLSPDPIPSQQSKWELREENLQWMIGEGGERVELRVRGWSGISLNRVSGGCGGGDQWSIC